MIKQGSDAIRYLVGTYRRPDSPLGSLLRAVPLNATTRQVLSLGRSEQFAYLDHLRQFNHDRADPPKARPEAVYRVPKTIGFMRRFNQLPCTLETRKARADLLVGEPLSRRILVLGDDDLLSVELAQRGFEQVTVADCDEQLLARIDRETHHLAAPPAIVKADFREGFSAKNAADIVFLDPPYSIAGAQTFLKLAVDAAGPTSRLFLMVNPFVLGEHFSQVTAAATAAGFRLVKQRERFNAYPMGRLEGAILKAAWRFFEAGPGARTAGSGLFFCSDCFEFVREGQAEQRAV